MKRIELSQGKYALVDANDYKTLSNHKWWYHSMGYAARTTKDRKCVLMHAAIMSTPKGMHTDHVNGNKLDNRKSNLRVCTPAQNTAYRVKSKNNSSGYKGVCWDKTKNKWLASIMVSRKSIYLGRYDSRETAYSAYKNASKKYFGEYAHA